MQHILFQMLSFARRHHLGIVGTELFRQLFRPDIKVGLAYYLFLAGQADRDQMGRIVRDKAPLYVLQPK